MGRGEKSIYNKLLCYVTEGLVYTLFNTQVITINYNTITLLTHK